MKNFSVMLFPTALLLTVNSWAIADEVNTSNPPATQGENLPAAANPSSAEATAEKPKRQLPPRLQQMKEALNLTNEQQELWQQFENTWVEQMSNMFARLLGKANNPQTSPERLQHQIAIMEKRLEALKKISGAQQALYQALTPEQRKIMDTKSAPTPKPQIEIKPNPQPEIPLTQSVPAPVLDKVVPESKSQSEPISSPLSSPSAGQKSLNEQPESSPAPQANSESQPSSEEKKESISEEKEEKKDDSAEDKKSDSVAMPSNDNPPTAETEKVQ